MAPRGRPPTCDRSPQARSEPPLDGSHMQTAPRTPHSEKALAPGRQHRQQQARGCNLRHLHALWERGATVPDTQAPWSSSSEGDSPLWRFHVWRGLQFLSETVRAGESKVQIPFFRYQINKKPRSR